MLGLLVQASGVLVSFVVLFVLVGLGLPRSTVTATIVLDLVELVAWFIAGAVAYEIARRRGAVTLTALVPPLIALTLLAAGVIVGRGTVNTHVLVLAPFWLALTVVAYLGGRWWERRIRRAGTLQ